MGKNTSRHAQSTLKSIYFDDKKRDSEIEQGFHAIDIRSSISLTQARISPNSFRDGGSRADKT